MSEMLKVYPAYIKGPPEEVLPTEETFVKIWAAMGCSRTKAINEIFEAGLDAVLDKNEELKSVVDSSAMAIKKKWQEKIAAVSRQGQLEYIYEHSTLDEFIGFCTENGIDHEAFLEGYRIDTAETKTKSENMTSWLKYILADGEEYSVGDIKESAEIDKVVNNDSDWRLMKSVASQKGYSSGGRRGYWRKLVS